MCLRVEGWGEVGAPACGQQCPGFETTPSLTHPRTPPHAAHLPALQRAIFPGDSELQQLLHIFKLLGTPSEEVWPGVTKLRDWHEFPQWHAQDMEKVFPKLCPAGIDLMMKMFEYDPANRLTVSGGFLGCRLADGRLMQAVGSACRSTATTMLLLVAVGGGRAPAE